MQWVYLLFLVHFLQIETEVSPSCDKTWILLLSQSAYYNTTFFIQINTGRILKFSIFCPFLPSAFYRVPHLNVKLLNAMIYFIQHKTVIIIYMCNVSWMVGLSSIVSMTTHFSYTVSFLVSYQETVFIILTNSDLSFAVYGNSNWCFKSFSV